MKNYLLILTTLSLTAGTVLPTSSLINTEINKNINSSQKNKNHGDDLWVDQDTAQLQIMQDTAEKFDYLYTKYKTNPDKGSKEFFDQVLKNFNYPHSLSPQAFAMIGKNLCKLIFASFSDFEVLILIHKYQFFEVYFETDQKGIMYLSDIISH